MNRSNTLKQAKKEGDSEYYTRLYHKFLKGEGSKALHPHSLFNDVYNVVLFNFEINQVVKFMRKVHKKIDDDLKADYQRKTTLVKQVTATVLEEEKKEDIFDLDAAEIDVGIPVESEEGHNEEVEGPQILEMEDEKFKKTDKIHQKEPELKDASVKVE